jgi:D-alanyl-D-alanine carboxypeptidase/D-alanyl-D-alanine carboxypeptidase (penicillin-binding protein 5/6)
MAIGEAHMLKKYLSVILLILISIQPVAGLALTSEPSIEAPSALLIELRRGQVLYSKNPDEPLHIAAASKLMTALIAIEKTENEMVTASKEAVNAEGAVLELSVGEKYTAQSLIYACMLSNANDAAIALAEAIGGTVDNFVKLMNDYAATLNMTNTHFSNPTGIYDENQRTTAADIAKLLRHGLSTNPEFERVFSTQAKPWFDDEKTIVLTNLNELFWSYDGVDGGKLDFNDPKLQTVITTATRGQQKLACILLDSPPESMYSDSIKLLDHGFNNFRRDILVSKGQVLSEAKIEGHSINLVAGADVYYTHPLLVNYIQNVEYIPVESSMKLPVYKNTVLGNVKFTLVDGTVITVDLFPEVEILPEMTTFEKIKKRIKEQQDIFYIVIALCAVEAILLLVKLVKWVVNRYFHRKRIT